MFCEKLRYLREHSEISQTEMAARLGILQSSYSKYEIGTRKPDYEVLKRIANIFNVSIDYLLENYNYDARDIVDLNDFILHGDYTLFSKFPTESDRKMISEITRAIFLREK
ncbi:MAG: helix-turn-helix transcriptional regulator [Selenomonadaceae bacterium]|nr:helix-turn-helix transcriptional regulator [Selenomonadaceae bacterium]MBR3722964.1 helix-turn-helix transcriptional regulator [Selenomonadaceae bacterium]